MPHQVRYYKPVSEVISKMQSIANRSLTHVGESITTDAHFDHRYLYGVHWRHNEPVVWINATITDPEVAARTAVHELRHAWQDQHEQLIGFQERDSSSTSPSLTSLADTHSAPFFPKEPN